MNQTTRRDALKALAAATGAVTLASLPTRWSKPTLRVGAVPAHAQASCLGVTIELISASGTIDISREQGPLPTSETGSFPTPGWTQYWACQTGCLQIAFFTADGATASWLVTVGPDSIPFNLGADEQREILINLSTLEYALDGNTPPSGCLWIIN